MSTNLMPSAATRCKNHFKVTASHEQKGGAYTFESRGYYDKMWQFSSAIVLKGFKIIEVKQIEKSKPDDDKIVLTEVRP